MKLLNNINQKHILNSSTAKTVTVPQQLAAYPHLSCDCGFRGGAPPVRHHVHHTKEEEEKT